MSAPAARPNFTMVKGVPLLVWIALGLVGCFVALYFAISMIGNSVAGSIKNQFSTGNLQARAVISQSEANIINSEALIVRSFLSSGGGYENVSQDQIEKGGTVDLPAGTAPSTSNQIGWQVGGVGSSSWIGLSELSYSGRCLYIWQSASGTVTHGSGTKPCDPPTSPQPESGLFPISQIPSSAAGTGDTADPILSSIAREEHTPGSPSVDCGQSAGVFDGREFVCFRTSDTSNLWGAPTIATASPTFHGGPIQAHPTVYIVGWGASADQMASVRTLATGALDAPWSRVLSAYGVGPGSLAGTWSDPDPVPPVITPQDLQAETARVANEQDWHLGLETQMWFVTGSTLSDGTSQSCGYHWWVGEAEGAIVAVSGGGSSCAGDTVGTLAHEYAEAATDPDNHDGYIASASSSDGEIADVCVRGGWAVSPVGPLPMLYQPGVGCSWGDWAPSEVWGAGIAAMAPPSSWTQCTGATKCAAWLFYPPGDLPPAGIAKANNASGGYWVVVPG